MSDTKYADSRESFCQAIRGLWWLILLRGVLLILLGAYALFNPLMTTVALAQVVGIYLILEGAIAIYVGLTGQVDSRIWSVVRGLILILAGAFAVSNPFVMAMVNTTLIVYLLAAGLIISGMMEIYAAIRDRREIEGEGWLILSGVLGILFGVILCASPVAAGMVMIQFLGAFTIIGGIFLIVASFRFRSFGMPLKERSQSL